ncbi:MerR family transcriptional regulator [Nakamurella silvestris]|nr:MerR family transcriptional regulator [Nakamurella silvestris]
MRPIDLGREHGLSAQAVRNYEEAGILPAAARSSSGYRRYTDVHAQALHAFLALRRGHGHQPATEIMAAINRGDLDAAFRLLDSAHLDLRTERGTRAEVALALRGLSAGTVTRTAAGTAAAASAPGTRPSSGGTPLSVGELARRIGVHPATVRTWEAAGILHPRRGPVTGYREFGPSDVRDAEIAGQLRRGGYRLHQVARFVESLREAGGADALVDFLRSWQDRLTTRSRDLLAGAAQLDRYLTLLDRRADPHTP